MDRFLQKKQSEEIKNIRHAMELGITEFVSTFSKLIAPYAEFLHSIRPKIDSYKPALERIAEAAEALEALDKLGDNQYVLWKPLSRELVAAIKTADTPEKIDAVIERYLENDDRGSIELCKTYFEGDLLFQETVTAFNAGLYNVAIVGFMAIFDRVMSECSGMLNDVNFRRRMEELEKRIDAKGDIYIDDLETKDYLLFITYFEATKGIGDNICSEYDCHIPCYEPPMTPEQFYNAMQEKERQTVREYEIYQLNAGGRDQMFMNMKELRAMRVTPNIASYDAVYKGTLEPGMTLDSLYTKFNVERPEDFKGHSLSVSDVIVVSDEHDKTAWFVDSFGLSLGMGSANPLSVSLF